MASKIENAEQLNYSKPDSYVNPSEKTTQLARISSTGRLTQGQLQESTSSLLDAHAAHGSPSSPGAMPEELDLPASPGIIHERSPSSNDLPSQPPGVNDKSRYIAEDDDGKGSTGHNANLVAPEVSPEKEIAQLGDERLVEVERKLSAVLSAQSERDRLIAQLTDELAQNSALLRQSEANRGELQAKLDTPVLSRDYTLEQAQSAPQKATSRAAEANERSQRELAGVRAELEARKSELAAVHLRLTEVENGWAKSKAEADTSGGKTAANVVNTDEDGVTRRLMERVRALEAQMASPRVWNEKSFEMMECTNED